MKSLDTGQKEASRPARPAHGNDCSWPQQEGKVRKNQGQPKTEKIRHQPKERDAKGVDKQSGRGSEVADHKSSIVHGMMSQSKHRLAVHKSLPSTQRKVTAKT